MCVCVLINDIVYASEIFSVVLFANDTNILLLNKNYECVENKVNTTLNKVYEWLFTNKSSINLSKAVVFSKTKTMINLHISITIT